MTGHSEISNWVVRKEEVINPFGDDMIAQHYLVLHSLNRDGAVSWIGHLPDATRMTYTEAQRQRKIGEKRDAEQGLPNGVVSRTYLALDILE